MNRAVDEWHWGHSKEALMTAACNQMTDRDPCNVCWGCKRCVLVLDHKKRAVVSVVTLMAWTTATFARYQHERDVTPYKLWCLKSFQAWTMLQSKFLCYASPWKEPLVMRGVCSHRTRQQTLKYYPVLPQIQFVWKVIAKRWWQCQPKYEIGEVFESRSMVADIGRLSSKQQFHAYTSDSGGVQHVWNTQRKSNVGIPLLHE